MGNTNNLNNTRNNGTTDFLTINNPGIGGHTLTIKNKKGTKK